MEVEVVELVEVVVEIGVLEGGQLEADEFLEIYMVLEESIISLGMTIGGIPL